MTTPVKMTKPVNWLVLTAVLALAPNAMWAEEPWSVAGALSAAAFPAELPLNEVKAFLEPRIVQPPVVTTREAWEQQASELRRAVLERVVFRGRAAEWRHAHGKVEWLETIAGGPGYHIRKFRFEALPRMWIPALLYEPDRSGERVPLALHVNGHDPLGKAAPYKQLRSINLAKRGLRVIDLEWFGMGQLRTEGFAHGRMNQLELCGASGLAPFYLAMHRALDVGLSLEGADGARVAVAGLSGGGWQTILISSLDERVTLANPVAGYASFHTNLGFGDLGDSEQAPTDMAALADYTHLTALRAPRPTLLTYNAKDDCCFRSGHAMEPLVRSARPAFALYGAADVLRTHVNHEPGTHNFERDNRQQYYAMIGDHFFAGDADFSRQEIASDAEVRKAEELAVEMPADNFDFSRLAASLAEGLPRREALPTTAETVRAWQQARRQRLKELLRVPHYEVNWRETVALPGDPTGCQTYRLRVGGVWTVPVTEFTAAAEETSGTVLLIADEGRAKQAAEVERLRKAGHRVVAVDPLLIGESAVKGSDPAYLYALFMQSVGERPLGVQAAQLTAIARWIASDAATPLTITAVGPRSSAAALVATAIEPGAIGATELSGGLASFHELLERNVAVEAMPELFAFSLLEEFDVRELVALAAPRPVGWREARERIDSELRPLAEWRELFEPRVKESR
jgi:hypothetical protein